MSKHPQFSKAEFSKAWHALRAHQAEEKKFGNRIAYPDCYYDPAGRAAAFCLSRRHSTADELISHELSAEEGRNFYRLLMPVREILKRSRASR